MVWQSGIRLSFIFKKTGSKIPMTCSKRYKSYYITTPIFYVNAVPHLGHLYTATVADTARRWEELKQEGIINKPHSIFATGTDEHGQKVFDAAVKAGLEPLEFCDEVSGRFLELYRFFTIDHTDFIRTTEERHKIAVRAFWEKLNERGFIYKDTYEGWYSKNDETFIPELNTSKIRDPKSGKFIRVSNETGHEVEWMEETNYVFRLTAVVDKVEAWIKENPDFIHPPNYRDRLLAGINKEDISISRERSRVPWGIETPSDPTQSIYVWLDALVNYLTVAGYPDIESEKFRRIWPADVHLIGMDILKFHGLYWPAFLMAAGIELPKKIVVHSHWLMGNRKMSKSIGNVVDPFTVAKIVTAEGVRFFLLKQGVLEHDCDYSSQLLLQAVNGDLCNTLGNCLNRAVSPKVNPMQTYPPFHRDCFPFYENTFFRKNREEFEVHNEDYLLIDKVRQLPQVVDAHIKSFHFYKAVNEIMDCVRNANATIHRNEIWNLDHANPRAKRLNDTVLHSAYEVLRVCAILLQVFVPELAGKTLEKLGVPKKLRTWDHSKMSFYEYDQSFDTPCPMTGRKLSTDKAILMERISPSKIAELHGDKKT